jgi:hypothetical protein
MTKVDAYRYLSQQGGVAYDFFSVGRLFFS